MFQQLLDCPREQPGRPGPWRPPVLGAMTAWGAGSGWGVCPGEGGRVTKMVKGTHTRRHVTGQPFTVQSGKLRPS